MQGNVLDHTGLTTWEGDAARPLFAVGSQRLEGVILDLSQWAMPWQLGITTSHLTSHGELMVHAGCGATRLSH